MYYIILNPTSRSGGGMLVWKHIKKEFTNRHIPYQLYYTEYKGHATHLSRLLTLTVEQRKLIVIGGDGTLQEVVCGIRDFSKVTIGYIPAGSSNDFVRDLQLPKDPVEAIRHILEGSKTQYFDIGTLSYRKHYTNFTVSSGIGLDAAVCHEALTSPVKKFLNKLHLGQLTYLFLSLKQISSYKPAQCHIIIDDTTSLDLDSLLFATAMIHKYEGGGFPFCPSAQPDDGYLDVCIIEKLPKSKLPSLLLAVLFKRHIKCREVRQFRCKSIEFHADTPLPVHCDGENKSFQSSIRIMSSKHQACFFA